MCLYSWTVVAASAQGHRPYQAGAYMQAMLCMQEVGWTTFLFCSLLTVAVACPQQCCMEHSNTDNALWLWPCCPVRRRTALPSTHFQWGLVALMLDPHPTLQIQQCALKKDCPSSGPSGTGRYNADTLATWTLQADRWGTELQN